MSDTWSGITNPGTRSHKVYQASKHFRDIYHYITDQKIALWH